MLKLENSLSLAQKKESATRSNYQQKEQEKRLEEEDELFVDGNDFNADDCEEFLEPQIPHPSQLISVYELFTIKLEYVHEAPRVLSPTNRF